jgi:hypothetical protein
LCLGDELNQKLLDLIQVKDFLDGLFELELEDTITELQKAAQESEIHLSLNSWKVLTGNLRKEFNTLSSCPSVVPSNSTPSHTQSSTLSRSSTASSSSYAGMTNCTFNNNYNTVPISEQKSVDCGVVPEHHRVLERGKKADSWVLTKKAKLIVNQVFTLRLLSEKQPLRDQTGCYEALAQVFKWTQDHFGVNATGGLAKPPCTKWTTKEIQKAVETYLSNRISNHIQNDKRNKSHAHTPRECWKRRPDKRVRTHQHIHQPSVSPSLPL